MFIAIEINFRNVDVRGIVITLLLASRTTITFAPDAILSSTDVITTPPQPI
jgi:hypothetical protein